MALLAAQPDQPDHSLVQVSRGDCAHPLPSRRSSALLSPLLPVTIPALTLLWAVCALDRADRHSQESASDVVVKEHGRRETPTYGCGPASLPPTHFPPRSIPTRRQSGKAV